MARPKHDPDDTRHELRATCVLLSDEDLEALRDLARLRARRLGGRASAGAVVRDLIRQERDRVAREVARA